MSVFLIFCIPKVYPETIQNDEALNRYLIKTHDTLASLISSNNVLSFSTLDDKLKENDALTAMNNARIENLSNLLINQKKLHQNTQFQLKKLYQKVVSTENALKINRLIAYNQDKIILHEKNIDLLQETISLARNYRSILEQNNSILTFEQSRYDVHQKIKAINVLMIKMSTQLATLYHDNAVLSDNLLSQFNQIDDANKWRVLLNEKKIALYQFQLVSYTLGKKWLLLNLHIQSQLNLTKLQPLIDLTEKLIKHTQNEMQSIQSMLSFFKNNQILLVGSVKNDYMSFMRDILKRKVVLQKDIQLYQQQLQQQEDMLKTLLASRQHLSDYRLDAWPDILQQLSQIPFKLMSYVNSFSIKWLASYRLLSADGLTMFFVCLMGILLIFVLLSRFLPICIEISEKMHISFALIDIVVRIIRKNYYISLLYTFLVFTCYWLAIPMAGYALFLNAIYLLVIYRIVLLILYRSLVESVIRTDGKDVKFYFKFKKMITIGVFIVFCLLLSQALTLSFIIQDLFNRLIMLYLFVISLILIRDTRLIRSFCLDEFDSTRKYLYLVLKVLLVLFPFTMIMTSIIGLVGYINFAWRLSQYQFIFISTIVGYVISRGLLLDTLDLVAKIMVRRLENGWLLVDVFLKPFSTLLRFSLLMSFFVLLLYFFGIEKDSTYIDKIISWVESPIIDFSGFHMTLKSFIEFIIVFSFFVWLSRWTREFCYRFLFKTKDIASRNSLAIFTHYAVIFFGGLITLHTLGFDFSGLSMILGGLAVGMGFGLRDFANNIIGGAMLLIERPVKEGDLITLGTHEGRVKHIGIRTMRLSTWDNMEVLIPNAEAFNKPFTNWTHQDSIVRTVVPIKIHRDDCPKKVQSIILKVLSQVKEVLKEPQYQVLLMHIDDVLMAFEVRYFINVEINTRVEVCSKILFAIDTQFKKAGIRPPITSYEVQLDTPKLALNTVSVKDEPA
jgi:potassium efflux system protein